MRGSVLAMAVLAAVPLNVATAQEPAQGVATQAATPRLVVFEDFARPT
jgi:hypothetical protein